MAKVQLAQRQYNETVSQVVPKQEMQINVEPLINVGEKIMQAEADASAFKALSQAQVDLRNLTTDYRLKNQSNPDANNAEFKEARKSIYDNLYQNVSPLARSAFNLKWQQLEADNDISNNDWALKQNQANVNTRIAESVKLNLNEAYAIGKDFGLGNSDNIEQIVKTFENNYVNLAQMGNAYLGTEGTKELLKNYRSDYMKMSIGGIIETNPALAIKMLNKKEVYADIEDAGTHDKLLTAAQNRLENMQAAKAEKEVLDSNSAAFGLVEKSWSKGLSVQEIYAGQEQYNLSPAAMSVLLKMNGYSKLVDEKTGKIKLSPDVEFAGRVDLEDKLTELKAAGDKEGADALISNYVSQGYLTPEQGLTVRRDFNKPTKPSEMSKSQIAQGQAQFLNDIENFFSEKPQKLRLTQFDKFFGRKPRDSGIDAYDVQVMNNKIFDAMDKGYITVKEGVEYQKRLIEPFNQAISEKIGLFEQQYPDSNLGFDDLKNTFEAYHNSDETLDNSNKFRFYNRYFTNLDNELSNRNLSFKDFASQGKKDIRYDIVQAALNQTKIDYANGLGMGRFETAIEADRAVRNKVAIENKQIGNSFMQSLYTTPINKKFVLKSKEAKPVDSGMNVPPLPMGKKVDYVNDLENYMSEEE